MLAGTINGSFTGLSSSFARPYITWNGVQNIPGNYTDVTVNVYFTSTSAYYAFNNANNHNSGITIGGDYNQQIANFNLNANSTILIRSRTVRVNHNADGTATIYIGTDGNPQVGWGTYNFGQTVSLDTIPREAYITNAVNFTVGNNIPLTIWNGGNFFIRSQLYVNGILIKTQDLGAVTTATITLDSINNTSIYNQMPSSTSISMFVRVQTFQNSNYTGQIGGNRDQGGTVYVNTAINAPIFSTYTLANIDKSISVKDKYNNTLITSSTATLLGSSAKYIRNNSLVRATVTSANKATAQNGATMSKYRFTNSTLQVEQNWSSTATVNLDLDNVGLNTFFVTAFDSRGLSTAIQNTTLTMIDYSPVSLSNVVATRQNNVDAITNLSFSGYFWNRYFGSGTTTPSGTNNALVIQYRYKETTQAWASQSWTTITPTISTDSISYNANINGNLGASGFSTDKSYNIEVRAYDRLSQVIVEITLSRGIPVMDITQNGIALNGIYNASEGGALQIDNKHIKKYIGELMYPIGSIYTNATNSTNPATLLGFGTWTAFGSGRVMVGYNSGDADFNASEKTGGSKTQTLATENLPAHTHTQIADQSGPGGANLPSTGLTYQAGIANNDGGYRTGRQTGSAGSGTAHNNLQPYITVYLWKRTA